jgi:hypothetical protein
MDKPFPVTPWVCCGWGCSFLMNGTRSVLNKYGCLLSLYPSKPLSIEEKCVLWGTWFWTNLEKKQHRIILCLVVKCMFDLTACQVQFSQELDCSCTFSLNLKTPIVGHLHWESKLEETIVCTANGFHLSNLKCCFDPQRPEFSSSDTWGHIRNCWYWFGFCAAIIKYPKLGNLLRAEVYFIMVLLGSPRSRLQKNWSLVMATLCF